jgi:hypothetical protein
VSYGKALFSIGHAKPSCNKSLQHRVHTLETNIFYSKFIRKLDIRLHWSYIN